MRTLVLIVSGLLLLALAMWLTKPAKRMTTAWIFTAVWLLVTLWNLFTGMSHGYSFQEELPIQSAIFAIPVIGAWVLAWQGRKR
ncbi:MAG: hypothetical protein EOP92_16535 [Lysobacteraceae bacterium]|nr:MAG: hypothetical protein EOP92_16535 [Xanthomonadaceae bacterium]